MEVNTQSKMNLKLNINIQNYKEIEAENWGGNAVSVLNQSQFSLCGAMVWRLTSDLLLCLSSQCYITLNIKLLLLFVVSDPMLHHPRRRHSSGNISTLEMLPGLEGFHLDTYGRVQQHHTSELHVLFTSLKVSQLSLIEHYCIIIFNLRP